MGIGKKVSWAALGVVLGAAMVLGGSALAAGSGGSPSAASPSNGSAPSGPGPQLLIGAVHADGTWAYADGSTKDLSADFGRITSVGSGSISLHRADGQDVTVPTSDATCVRQRGRQATLGDLQTGEAALVIEQDGQAQVARAGIPIRGGTPCGLFAEAVHGHATVLYRDGTTRTFDLDPGRITKVGDGSVTLIRRDRSTVTVPSTATTAVVLDCKPARLSDLKAGDLAMAVSEDGSAVVIHASDGLEMAGADQT